MLTYLRYFQNRYLNEKGQGMVEYAVILAIVVAIGVALSANGGFQSSITTLYSTIATRVAGLLPATPAQ